MAKEVQTQPKPDRSTDLAAGDFLTFAQEYDEDRKTMRWAGIVAVILHIIFFVIQFPEMVAAEREQKKAKVYVVQQVRFKPPPPKQQQEIPKPKSKKVPIPDPTPDEPEPLRLQEDIEPEVEMPDTDIIMGIPDGPPPMEPTGPIRVGGDVKPPKKIIFPSPQYTEIARKARITGVVIVEAIIDKQGNVTNVKVLKGLPMGLDQAAAEAVKRWKFEPATLNGKPVAVIYNLTVNFQLQ
ncbi:MAG: energy transducer TonB [bacterium]|nr:energy transducer TonB [bacterium]